MQYFHPLFRYAYWHKHNIHLGYGKYSECMAKLFVGLLHCTLRSVEQVLLICKIVDFLYCNVIPVFTHKIYIIFRYKRYSKLTNNKWRQLGYCPAGEHCNNSSPTTRQLFDLCTCVDHSIYIDNTIAYSSPTHTYSYSYPRASPIALVRKWMVKVLNLEIHTCLQTCNVILHSCFYFTLYSLGLMNYSYL